MAKSNARLIAELLSPTSSAHTPEGTAVKSTGETGATEFLREDGDDTSSWQTIEGGGYTSKTISVNTTLDANTEYETGSSTSVNDGVTLSIPVSSILVSKHYATGKPL
mgnify:FL=1